MKPIGRVASITAAFALLLAVACGGGSPPAATVNGGSGKGTIVVWADQSQSGQDKATQAEVAAFNASQTDVKAVIKFIPDADLDKTTQATSPSELGDVVEVDGPYMQAWIREGKLGPINGLVSAQTIQNQIPSVIAQDTVNGKLFMVAQIDSGLGIYGNKALLDAAGISYPTTLDNVWTADQFTADLAKLAAKNPSGKALDLKLNYQGEWPTYGFLPIVYSAGSAVMKGGKAAGNLDNSQVVAAAKTFASWKPYVDANTDDSAFVKGRVAMSWVGHWVYPAYSKALGTNLVVMPLPDFGNGSKTGQGSIAWGINTSRGNGKAAAKLLDFFANDANVTDYTSGAVDGDGAVPATKTALAESTLYAPSGPLYLFAQQLNKTCGSGPATKDCVAVPRPQTPGYPVISSDFSAAWFNIFNGADPQAELTKAAQLIDTDFQDNGGYRLSG